jgi:hypothetical protein
MSQWPKDDASSKVISDCGGGGGVVDSCVIALAGGARRGAHTMPVEKRAKSLGRPGIL